MSKIIYGVDTSQVVTPIMARNAMVRCFQEAHKVAMKINSKETIPESDLLMLEIVIEKHNETGGDFNHPTKESLLKTMHLLKEFADHFRSETFVEKHFREMLELVEMIEE